MSDLRWHLNYINLSHFQEVDANWFLGKLYADGTKYNFNAVKVICISLDFHGWNHKINVLQANFLVVTRTWHYEVKLKIKKMNVFGDREMALWVKTLFCKHKYLSLGLNTNVKSWTRPHKHL